MKLNIFDIAVENEDYREVITTGVDSQLVVMSIPPGQDIGDEMYTDVDQITVVVRGKARYSIAGESSGELIEEDLLFVPAGKDHEVVNIGDEDLKLFTIYAPPEHEPGTVQETKADALEDEGVVPMDESDLYGDDLEDEY